MARRSGLVDLIAAATTLGQISDVHEARQLLGPPSVPQRQWRSRVGFAAGLTTARSRLGVGQHDRGEEYVFADGRLPAGDLDAYARHFPLALKTVELDACSIAAGRTLDLTATRADFPDIAAETECYLLVRIGCLRVAPRSRLLVRGNVFVLDCVRIEATEPGRASFTIDIAPGLVRPSRLRAVKRQPADLDGADGGAGRDGIASERLLTPFGSRLLLDQAARGGDGQPGRDGLAGGTGGNGGMSMLTDIRIGAVAGFAPRSLTIRAKAGDGAPGQPGGRGGRGGRGGAGYDGERGLHGLTPGAPGGAGGAGGAGGDGGRGGNGGLACDVFVSVPRDCAPILRLVAQAGLGGAGGAPGPGGAGGSGGRCGALAADGPPGAAAADEAPGPAGRHGPPGRTRAAPRIHLHLIRRLSRTAVVHRAPSASRDKKPRRQ